ncbi:MAG TPA: small multi-drug export protein [Methanobacteriaceae archaeon]|nr:small multi-drug export protein [Methanobacteriaceae archaeon]
MSLESILAVFTASILELWLAVPLGLILKLNPIIVFIVSATGSIIAAILVIMAGDNLRHRFIKWKYKDEKNIQSSRLYEIWNKYGVIGLGLSSPLLFGAPLGAAVGIVLGAKKDRLILWMSVGIIIWSIGLTTAGVFGIMSFENFLH